MQKKNYFTEEGNQNLSEDDVETVEFSEVQQVISYHIKTCFQHGLKRGG